MLRLKVLIAASASRRLNTIAVANSLVVTAGVEDGEQGRIYWKGQRLDHAVVNAAIESVTHPGARVTIEGRHFIVGGMDASPITVRGKRLEIDMNDTLWEVMYDPKTDTIR